MSIFLYFVQINMTDITNYGDIILRDLAARHGTFFNPTAGDGAGDRDVLLDFKGKDVAGTIHQLATMSVSHDGTGTDLKGKYVMSVNDGDDVGTLTTAMTVTSGSTTLHSDAAVGGALDVTGTATVGTGLTVTAGGASVTGASSFDTVTINGTGTALDVVNGDMNVGGALTVGSFSAASYTGLDLDDVADSATRVAMSTAAQTFSGSKSFWDLKSTGGFSLGTGGTKVHFWDAANTNRLWFHEDLKTKIRGRLTFVDVSSDADPVTFDTAQHLLFAKSTAPYVQNTLTLDQAGSTDVVLGRMEWSGQHSDLYRTGAKIRVVTSATQWDGADATVAPTEIQFFTQSATAVTDNLTSPGVTIDSNGYLRALKRLYVTNQAYFNAGSGYGINVASNAKVSGYLESTGINVLSGGTNSVAGDLGLTGGLTITQNTGSSLTIDGTAPVAITPDITATGTLLLHGQASLVAPSGLGLAVTSDATIGGTLLVSSTSTFTDTLSITKASGTGLSVTADALVSGGLTVTGALGLTGDLTGVNISSSGVLTASGPNNALVVSNNATVGGNLVVTGTTTTGALSGTSTADFTGIVSCQAPSGTGLDVTKNAIIGGTLAVTGNTTLTGAVTAASLTSSGVVTVNEAVANVGVRNEGISELVGHVKCLAPTGTGLTVTNNAIVSGVLTINKLTTVPGTYALDSYGNAKFRDDMDVWQDLTVGANTTLSGPLVAVGATFSDTITANKAGGTGLSVTNNAVVGGTLSAGATTLASGSVTNTLTVNGLLTASLAGQLALSVSGNAAVGGTLSVTGTSALNGAVTMESAAITNQLVINQLSGTGLNVVSANARVGGSLTVAGDLFVNGTHTYVDTATLTVQDNIIVVNKDPSVHRDGGVVVERFSGDVVMDTPKESGTLDGAAAGEATLPAGMAGAVDEYYTGWYLKITNDSPAGALDQVRKITKYTHSTRVIEVADWDTQPDATTTFSLFNRPYVGVAYDESADEFAFLATALDPVNTINIQEYLNLRVNSIATNANTTLGGDLVVGNFSVAEPGSYIELASASPAMKFIKNGADRLTIDTSDIAVGTGSLTMQDGTIAANATSGNALSVSAGATSLLNTGVTGVLTVTGTSTQSGTATFNGGVTVDHVTATDATVTGTLTITGTGDLDVNGSSNFSQPATFTSSLTGTSANLSTTLGVTGVATFTAQSVHTNGIDAGSSDIDTLVVSGSGTALTVTNTMSATGLVTGATGLVSAGPLDINSTSDFGDTLTISKTTGDGLSVVANSDLQGNVTVGGNLGVSGTLTGAAATFSTLTASGGANVNTMTTGAMTTTGTLTVTDTGDLDCDGTADFASTLNVVGLLSGTSATLSTTLGVTGVATFTAQSVHNGGIDVNAASDITALTVSGTGTALTVSNNASVGGTLAVVGSSTFTASAQFLGGIDVDAASDITSLTVSGVGTGLSVTNTASLGALQVAGASTLTGLLTLPGGFDANDSTVTKLTVDGGDTTTLIVNQGATVGADFAVTGASTFTGASTHNGGVIATSGSFSSLASTLASGTGLDVTADTHLNGDVRVGPALAAGAESDTLSVVGTIGLVNNSNSIENGETIGSISMYGVDYNQLRKGAEIRVSALGGWSNASPTEFKAPTRMEFFMENSAEATAFTNPAFSISATDIAARAPTAFHTSVTANTTLTVNGTSTLGVVNASGAVTLSAAGTALTVTNAASVGNFTATGTSALTGAITASSTLGVADTVSITKASGTGLDVTADATIGGTLTVNGNLNITGTTTTVDTATLAVEDHNIELGVVATPTDLTADGGGITLKGDVDKTITYDNTNTSWDFSENVNIVSGKEYRIDDVRKLTDTSVYLGVGSGDGKVFIGNNLTNGSWRIDVDGNGDLRFAKRESGAWAVKQTIG